MDEHTRARGALLGLACGDALGRPVEFSPPTRIENGEPWDEAGHNEWEASPEGSNAGNGSLMRCAPYAIAYRNDRDELVRVSRDSSAITHADPRCQWGCALFNYVLAELLSGDDEPLEVALEALGHDLPGEVGDAVGEVLAYRNGEVATVGLQNSGYVVTTLQAGLYHGLTAETAEDAIVDAVMMGGDTDTIAAVTGAVAGARFGADALPNRWLSELAARDELDALADGLLEISN